MHSREHQSAGCVFHICCCKSTLYLFNHNLPSSLSYMQLNKCSVEFIPYVRTRCPVQSSEDIEPKTPKRKQPVTVIVSLSSSLINSSIKNTNNCQCENASCCAHRHFSLVEEAITKKNNKKKTQTFSDNRASDWHGDDRALHRSSFTRCKQMQFPWRPGEPPQRAPWLL